MVFYEKPLIKFERLLETYLSFAPRGFRSFRMAMPVWLREKLFQKHMLTKELRKFAPDFDAEKRLLFSEHHLTPRCLRVLSEPVRGGGRPDHGRRRRVEHDVAGDRPGQGPRRSQGMHFPHSIGLLYSAFTYYLGFKVNSGEYKVMGLAHPVCYRRARCHPIRQGPWH